MSNVVSLDERRPHAPGDARCIQCGHTWMAVAPVGTFELQCPVCETYRGAFVGMTAPEYVWQCNCGNNLFFLHEGGAMCAKCGDSQIFE